MGFLALSTAHPAFGQISPATPAAPGAAGTPGTPGKARVGPYGLPPAEGVFPEVRTAGTSTSPYCSADLPAGTLCVWPGPSGYLVAPYENPSPKYFSKFPTNQTRPYAIFLGNDGSDFRIVGSSIVLYSLPVGTRCDPAQPFILETANDFFTRDCEERGKTP
jgi:hypothetical protein